MSIIRVVVIAFIIQEKRRKSRPEGKTACAQVQAVPPLCLLRGSLLRLLRVIVRMSPSVGGTTTLNKTGFDQSLSKNMPDLRGRSNMIDNGSSEYKSSNMKQYEYTRNNVNIEGATWY